MASPAKHDPRARVGTDRPTAKLASLRAEPVGNGAISVPEPLRIDLHSDAPLPELDKLPPVSSVPNVPSSGTFWLDGDTLMCGCPDCRAPMSVRLWLMIADCWRCGTSIELSQEQEREAMRLLQEREQAMRRAQQTDSPKSKPAEPRSPARSQMVEPAAAPPVAHASPTAPPRDKASPRPQSTPTPPPRDRAAPTPPPQERRRVAAPSPTIAPPAAPVELSVIGTTGIWIRDAFRDMPAWLISLIFHLVMMTMLGLLTFGDEVDQRLIVLSVRPSDDIRREGDDIRVKPMEEVTFDLPVPDKIAMQDPKTREVMVRADQDARELRLNPDAVDRQLPDINAVKDSIGKGGTSYSPLLARDPRVRVEMVKAEGGTTLTEASVARGLRWIAKNQHGDGSWKLQSLPYANGGQGGIHSDSAATSLALLPFLGAGQTHLVGKYKDNVSAGLRWLVQHQKPDGDLRGQSHGNSGMYAHGQSAIVLCEAYGMSRDEMLKEPAQKALDFIVDAQHSGGGWRYEPGQAGDTSVVGWQLMALQSGRAAGLKVPDATLENASHYLDTVASERNSRYSYQRGSGPTHVMTAEALLCRIYLGWKKDEPGLTSGVDWLLEEHLPRVNETDIYYWYYATQTMHHYGGPQWNRWNLHMRDVLVGSQELSGRNAGSWAPQGPHASAGGRLYMTSLSVCTLEVYYRHLPVFRQLKID